MSLFWNCLFAQFDGEVVAVSLPTLVGKLETASDNAHIASSAEPGRSDSSP